MILESLTRAFVDPSAAVYAAALAGEQILRFADPETGLELAAVWSPKLSAPIIAGRP
jgi:hypothetical protein